MSENFRKNVRIPEELAKKARKFIESKHPVKYVKSKSAGKKRDFVDEAVDKTEMVVLSTLKGAAWLAAGGSQFLLTLARWLTADNVFLRKMEKYFSQKKVKLNQDGKPKTMSSSIKNNPNAYAHILWLLGLVAVGYVGAEYGPDAVQKIKKIVSNKKSKEFKDFIIDPTVDDETWNSMIDAVHPYVLSHIISSEGFIKRVYDDNFGSGTLTIGSGFALLDKEHRNFAEKILGRRVGNGASITIEENRRLVSAWLYKKIYPKIKESIKVPIDSKLFVILSVAAYNKGSNTYSNKRNTGYPVAEAINKGKSKEDIANTYVRCFGGIKGTGWAGLVNKYAVAALYYLDDVDDITILNSIAEAPYTLEKFLPENNSRLLIYESNSRNAKAKGVRRIDNIKELLLAEKNRVTKGTRQEPVRNYLTSEQVDLIEKGLVNVSGATINYEDYVEKDKRENKAKIAQKSEELNAEGEDLFFEKKYKKAITKFESALEADPKNYIVYSNLSLSYYKIGEYQRGLEVVQRLINSSFIKAMPDDIKGYTYYNAALCRTAIGDNSSDIAEKKFNYNMAQKNLKLAKKFSGLEYSDLSDMLNKKIHSDEFSQALKVKNYDHAIRKLSKTNNNVPQDIKLLKGKSKDFA